MFPGAIEHGGPRWKMSAFWCTLEHSFEATGDGLLKWVFVDRLLKCGAIRPELVATVSDLYARSAAACRRCVSSRVDTSVTQPFRSCLP
eukprot:3164522-Alexandrium_andersonii.AAC.1